VAVRGRDRAGAAALARPVAFATVLPLLMTLAVVDARAALATMPPIRDITFPVDHPDPPYGPDWHAPRDGGARQHLGNDIFAARLTPLLAARSGVISRGRSDAGGISGNYIAITDAEGWEYLYIHINNDTPGTDDGANPAQWQLFPGLAVGSRVQEGQPVAYLGDSGNAENSDPQLHFEIRRPVAGSTPVPINPFPSLRTAQGRPIGDQCEWSPSPRPSGSNRSDIGYRAVYGDGGIFAYGRSTFHGSTGGLPLVRPIVTGQATPSGLGYWLVAADGGVFAYGDARFHGSAAPLPLVAPIVGMAPTPTGRGYWLVAADGGVFTYGDARFMGSLGGRALDSPVVDIATGAGGAGYWLLSRAGGIYPFGGVTWHGSVQASGLCVDRQAVALLGGADGRGYWIMTTDGEIRPFGSSSALGDRRQLAVTPAGAPVGLIAAARAAMPATAATAPVTAEQRSAVANDGRPWPPEPAVAVAEGAGAPSEG
jgi:Peptidase family M23